MAVRRGPTRGTRGAVGDEAEAPLPPSRYVEWHPWRCASAGEDCTAEGALVWDETSAVELYAHPAEDDGSCFDCFEFENVAGDPEQAATVAALHAQLVAGWRGALPPAA